MGWLCNSCSSSFTRRLVSSISREDIVLRKTSVLGEDLRIFNSSSACILCISDIFNSARATSISGEDFNERGFLLGEGEGEGTGEIMDFFWKKIKLFEMIMQKNQQQQKKTTNKKKQQP